MTYLSGMCANTAEAIRSRGPAGRHLSELLFKVGVALYLSVAIAGAWEAVAFFGEVLPSLFPTLEAAVGPLCHHLPERTLTFNHRALPVCARCTGLWIGWILAGALWFFPSPSQSNRRLGLTLSWAFATAATLALLETAGVLALGNLSRATLGLPLGLVPGWLILNSFEQRTIRRDP